MKSPQEKTALALAIFFILLSIPSLISDVGLKRRAESIKYGQLFPSFEKITSFTCTKATKPPTHSGFKITAKTEVDGKTKIYQIPINPSCSIDEKWAAGKVAKIYQPKLDSPPKINKFDLGDHVWEMSIEGKYIIKFSEKVAHVKRYANLEIATDIGFFLFGVFILIFAMWPEA